MLQRLHAPRGVFGLPREAVDETHLAQLAVGRFDLPHVRQETVAERLHDRVSGQGGGQRQARAGTAAFGIGLFADVGRLHERVAARVQQRRAMDILRRFAVGLAHRRHLVQVDLEDVGRLQALERPDELHTVGEALLRILGQGPRHDGPVVVG